MPDAAAGELQRQAQQGQLDSDVVRSVLDAAGHESPSRKRERPAGLSDRELEVLRLAARGLSNKQMAEALFVSPKTVGHHVQHIYDKIGVSTRVGATLFALQHGILEEAS
jgi:DNA-binding NarL/FixJ family response regulator